MRVCVNCLCSISVIVADLRIVSRKCDTLVVCVVVCCRTNVWHVKKCHTYNVIQVWFGRWRYTGGMETMRYKYMWNTEGHRTLMNTTPLIRCCLCAYSNRTDRCRTTQRTARNRFLAWKRQIFHDTAGQRAKINR